MVRARYGTVQSMAAFATGWPLRTARIAREMRYSWVLSRVPLMVFALECVGALGGNTTLGILVRGSGLFFPSRASVEEKEREREKML